MTLKTIWIKLMLSATVVALSAFGQAGDTKAKAAKVVPTAETKVETKAKMVAKKAETATPAATLPTAKEVADAKAGGLVWVNLNTKVYHKEGQYYGTTKNGKFMTEAEAKKMGATAAKQSAAAKTEKAPAVDPKSKDKKKT